METTKKSFEEKYVGITYFIEHLLFYIFAGTILGLLIGTIIEKTMKIALGNVVFSLFVFSIFLCFCFAIKKSFSSKKI